MLCLTLCSQYEIYLQYFHKNDVSIKIWTSPQTAQNKHGQNTNIAASCAVMSSSGDA